MEHATPVWDKGIAYKILVRKLVGKRTLCTHRRRWEDRPNIEMDLKEVTLTAYIGFMWLKFGFSGGLV
jgi:hypothetical protein